MTKKFITIAVLAGGLALAGCAEQGGPGTKQTIGAGTGAVLGGLAGAAVGKSGSSATRAAATGIGAVAGLLLGSEIGKHMDQADRDRANQAVSRAHTAPLGEEITWNNPDSGNYGTVVPTRDGTNQSGQYCREYRTTVNVGGDVEEAYGTACQQSDGSWKIVS
ncbi:RT0821/Lpp0805 family surface protein [Aquibaculum arenosum]|uniref:RT0821/Lpp0805 family surface protein n=1 Tax=Aquibaculum arenosum TaxID=3032591 RepID=A0ABT5YIX5_9PROT|nr:RT0821/Lpp0805 family surface protein [Fodinicurvata sp. CAU 1616]MDF2094896.1 RT0821/Lpp0805 family surface protein [Fodinicurvata sp. CAU 1616]